MKAILKISVLIFIITLFSQAHVFSQVSYGGTPISFTQKTKKKIKSVKLKHSVIEELIKTNQSDSTNPAPFRFGVEVQVKYNVLNSGSVEKLENGDILWRLKICSPGAKSLGLFFGQFKLPEGAKLFIYTPDKKNVRGAFTSENNLNSGKFPTAQISGDCIILEYTEPEDSEFKADLEITKVIHDYTGLPN